ncbi:MAG: FAD-dependent monooxygenase [Alphaproteobacteria bacterium]|nr:FAD-dependent monooxygenase [Alphaproteobacteria bacterium]
MRRIVCDVLISGQGFTGSALACALAGTAGEAREMRVVTVEQDKQMPASPGASVSQDGRASALNTTSLRLLSRLGVEDHIRDAIQPVTSMQVCDGELDEAVYLPFLSFDTSGDHDGNKAIAFIVSNSALREGFARQLAKKTSVTRLFGQRIEAFKVTNTRTWVKLDDGQEIEASLLVAADGARSRLRDLARIKVLRRNTGQWGLTASVALGYEHEGQAIQHFFPGGPFALLPLPGAFASLVWTEPAHRARCLMELPLDALHEELIRRSGCRFGDIRLVSTLQGWPLFFQIARSFVSERIALTGDAAHLIHPLAGQGLNLALRDIAALTDCIQEAVCLGLDPGDWQVLERYQRWRRFDTVMMGTAMEGLNGIFSNDMDPIRMVRDLGMGLLERVPLLKGWMMSEAAGEVGTLPRLLRDFGD